MTELNVQAPTETAVAPAINALQFAVARQSVAGVTVALIAELNREVTLDEIVDFCTKNGLRSDKAKISASVATLATHGKIDRGLAKQTFAPAGSVNEEARAAYKALASESAAKAVPREKKSKVPNSVADRIYTNEEVFQFLMEKLGEPRKFQIGKVFGPSFTLLGDASPEHIWNRATTTFGGAEPKGWTVTQIAENVMVMLLAD